MTGRRGRTESPGGPRSAPLPRSRRGWLGIALLLAVLALGLAALMTVDLPSVSQVRSWLAGGGPERWIAATLGLALALLTPISRTALSVLIGAAAGFTSGLVVALSAGLLAGVAGFALSRRLGRAVVARWAGDRFARADRVLQERGFLAVLTARLMPVAPFAVVTYAAGLSAVRVGPYLLGTAVGLVPWSVLYVGVGASAVHLGAWAGHLDDPVVLVGTVVLAALGVAGWRWRRGAGSAARDRC